MAVDAIELLLIAHTLIPQALLGPLADLDSRVLSCKTIALLFEEGFLGVLHKT